MSSLLLALTLAGSSAFASDAAHPPSEAKAAQEQRELDNAIGVLDAAAQKKLQFIEEKVTHLRRQAAVATRVREFKNAETFYLQILTFDLAPEMRREVMLEMVKLYDASAESAKQAALLEKFAITFPEDPTLPQIFIKLGLTYRDMGLFKMALARFYSVLNYSLRIEKTQIEEYKVLSVRAQLEIADTHFMMGNYAEAATLYKKFRMLTIERKDLAHTIFRTAYCHYLLKEDAESVANFEFFIREFPEDSLRPEATFLLANTYSRLGRYNEATRLVLDLLRSQEPNEFKDEKQWVYWQKKAGNQLANDLFNQEDYSSALVIYQSLLELALDADWQWPLLYQIGVCYERLNMSPKAQESYKIIVNWSNEEPAKERDNALKSKTLESIFEMAKWRLGNIDWKQDTRGKFEKLLDKSGS